MGGVSKMDEKTISKLNILRSLINLEVRIILTKDGNEIQGILKSVEEQKIIINNVILDVYDIETFFVIKKPNETKQGDNLF
ncbi:MAG: hypothetical protein DWQ06_12430 [Calditrichaeota bacterium]|nr:MAG: hypothetical protein DWQ06_12430 [Calditrichota bacterium]